jgi:hypothetical protein
MGPRFVFTALIVAFGIALVFATFTTVRHVSTYSSSLVHQTARS